MVPSNKKVHSRNLFSCLAHLHMCSLAVHTTFPFLASSHPLSVLSLARCETDLPFGWDVVRDREHGTYYIE